MDVVNLIQKNYESMSDMDKRIADHILNSRDIVIKANIHKMAEVLKVSSSSISRFVHKYCHMSFSEFKIDIASQNDLDAYNKSKEMFDWADSLNEMPANIIQSISKTCNDVVNVNGIETFNQAIEWIHNAETVYFYGIGSSGIVAMDFQQKLMRLEKRCIYNMDSNFGVLNSKIVTDKDIVIAISFSGRTKEVNLAVKESQETGAKCIAITRNANSELESIADLSLMVTSMELNATRLAPIFSRYGQLFIVDILFLGLAKKETRSVEDFMTQYRNLLESLKLK